MHICMYKVSWCLTCFDAFLSLLCNITNNFTTNTESFMLRVFQIVLSPADEYLLAISYVTIFPLRDYQTRHVLIFFFWQLMILCLQ